MLESLVGAGQILVILWAVMALHVAGHYFTGRQIVDIPAAQMRMVSVLAPRYVALQDNDGEWVGPQTFEQYRKCYERHDPEYEHLERFVAGGEIIQVLVVVPAAIGLALVGLDGVAAMLLVVSMLVTVVYVAIDAVHTRQTGTLSGDYSALWYVSPRIPALLLIGFFFVHLGSFYFVA